MVKECSIHDIHKHVNMVTKHGLNCRQTPYICSFHVFGIQEQKTKRKKNAKWKFEGGNRNGKRLAFRMFKFSIHVCTNAGDKGNIQRTMPNSTN